MNNHTFRARLNREWRTSQEYDVIDVGMGYYVARFATMEDCNSIITGGPYKLFDHYLAVQPWEPNFQPARATRPKTTIWIHFEGIGMEYFTDDVLFYLGEQLGVLIKVDCITSLATRGEFARVCVQMDLSKPLLVSVVLDCEEDVTQNVYLKCVYGGLHTICFACGEYGHKMDFCRYNVKPNEEGSNVPLSSSE